MLHALLQGKLDPATSEPDRRDDALTSTVFGTLAMVEAWRVLAGWLAVPSALSESAERECWFWPRLAGGVEPDVVLRLGNALLVVEAKYRSGRHDLHLEDEDERPADQLLRQCLAIAWPPHNRAAYAEPLERAIRECSFAQVFVVDARRLRRARREFDESRQLLPHGAKLAMATWQDLYGLLSHRGTAGTRWAQALVAYLHACGLASFLGVRRDLAPAVEVAILRSWAPRPVTTGCPSIRAAAGALAEPTIVNLAHWGTSMQTERRSSAR